MKFLTRIPQMDLHENALLTLFLLGGVKLPPKHKCVKNEKLMRAEGPQLFFTRLKYCFACFIKNLGHHHA